MISQERHDFFLIGAVLLLMAVLDLTDRAFGLTARFRLMVTLGIYGFIMAVYLVALLI
jgi:hypothetical protein